MYFLSNNETYNQDLLMQILLLQIKKDLSAYFISLYFLIAW